MPNRFPMLDVLRTIAVLMVLGRHMPNECLRYDWTQMWFRLGWAGVDLFFVLSGFLVGGLLMKELKATGRISLGRFYVRRGFKIYPAFYVLLAVTLIVALAKHDFWPKAFVIEAAFLRSYWPKSAVVWGHTWSLSVEEHFYIAIPVLIAILARFRAIRLIPAIVFAACVACLALRIATYRHSWVDTYFATHLRIDSLLVGVLLAYLYHFHAEWFGAISLRYRLPIAVLGAACFMPMLVYEVTEVPWVVTWGFVPLYIGSACLVAWASTFTTVNVFLRSVAWVGTFSYSIYLWHFPVLDWGISRFSSHHPLALLAAYIVACFIVGVVLSKAIEYPVLRMRDRWFPAKA